MKVLMIKSLSINFINVENKELLIKAIFNL